ncbi:hypothetical protein [Enterococcus lemanii]|uniref:Uncharacterized protein n=1 Tax=Enterococcus lemanii TaxID=1159752 RepID=A0ABV9MS55_9ENTE|nr:hypothetical protein [Enterococcus lemanii]MBM7709556.1 hypothetical protein [Enterococcus lemanii]
MNRQENLLDYLKGKWTMQYLYTNAYLKKEKKRYPIGLALLNGFIAILAVKLPVFIVAEEFDLPMGTFGGMRLSGSENVWIYWGMLGISLGIHILLYIYQNKEQLFFKGWINFPTIIGLLWLFFFQEKLRYWAAGFALVTGVLYYTFYFEMQKKQ